MNSSRAGLFLLAVTLLSAAGTAQEASACGKGELLFADPNLSNAAWNFGRFENFSTDGDRATAELSPGTSHTILNQVALYSDIEVCARFSVSHPQDWDGWVGVAFWASDQENNYSVAIVPADRGVGIYRGQNGITLEPVPYFNADVIRQGPGAVNEISVTLTSNRAAIRVNDTLVKEFDGYPPAAGGLVGLDIGASSDAVGVATVQITGFEVRVPEQRLTAPLLAIPE